MGLFSPFIYVSKKTGQKFWLHAKQRGKMTLYYFSKDPIGALNNLPKGFEVAENPVTGMPFLKKKQGGGFLFGILGKPKPKEETSEKKEEEKEAAPESK